MAKGITAKRVGHAALRVLRWMAVMLRNGRLPAGVGAFALGATFMWLATDPAFTVHRVVVSGVVTLPGTTLAETSGVLGQSIFSVDPDTVVGRVAAMPGVQYASVHAEVPDTLVIQVRERNVSLVWDAGTASFVLDGTGMVIGTIAPNASPSVPVVHALPGVAVPSVGTRVDRALLRTALSLNERLPTEAGLTQANLVVDPVVGMVVQTPEWRAIIGTDDQLGRKLAVLKAMLAQPTWSEVDLRDPDRAVLTRKPGTGAVTPTPARKP
jgi:cell division septal protein FtsQ